MMGWHYHNMRWFNLNMVLHPMSAPGMMQEVHKDTEITIGHQGTTDLFADEVTPT